MTNPIDIAIQHIFDEIPEDLLKIAFAKREPWEAVYPLEEMVLNKIIRKRVLKDANIFGGKQKQIVLRPEYMEKLKFNKDDGQMNTGPFSVFRIPPEEREYVPLVDVIGLQWCRNYTGSIYHPAYPSYGTTLTGMGNAVLDAMTFASAPPRPNVTLLSGDLVRLWPSQHSTIVWAMNCKLAYDKDFTNLNTSAILPFADLCVCAVKMYLYRHLKIQIDRAYIEGGYEINEFKTQLDSYQDASQRYNELLTELVGSVNLDPETLKTFLPYVL